MKNLRASAVPRSELLELVRHAVLAPSGHNTQPWRFALHGGRVEILPDLARRLEAVDPDDHALYISLGAALENLRIAALHRGLDPETEYFPAAAPDRLVVHLTRRTRAAEDELFRAIPDRQTTRSTYDGRSIPSADLRDLERASAMEGVQFHFFTEKPEVDAVTELVKEGNRWQMRDPALVRELLHWVRFSRNEIRTHNDGLIGPAMGMPAVPRWLGETIMKTMLRPEPEAARAEKLIRSSAAFMLFVAEKDDRKHWVKLGQSFERVALTATVRGIQQAHMNMPCEVVEVRKQFQQYLGLADQQPLLLLRIGYGKLMPRSPRRPLEAVIA
jgi:hypothetical protein